MKAVVVEIRGSLAAVLSDGGRIVKVKNQNYAIGQVIEMKEIFPKLFRFKAVTAAAAASVVMLCGVGAYAYYTPYSYVSLDVNPSIQYALNRFDRVLSVTGVNDDGEEILKQLKLDSLGNKKIDEAIAQTVQQIKDDGFFDGDTAAGIVIATSGKDLKKAEKLAEALKQDAENAAGNEDVSVESSAVGLERVQQANELGVTPGKLNLVEKLRDNAENPADVDLEEWLDKPVKDIMKAIKEDCQEDKNTQQEQTNKAGSRVVVKTEPKTEKAEAKAEEKAEVKPEKSEAKVEEKAKVKPEKSEAKAEEKAESKTEKSEAKAGERAEVKPEKSEAKAEEKAESKPEKSEAKAEEKAEVKPEKFEAKAEEKAESKPGKLLSQENAKQNKQN